MVLEKLLNPLNLIKNWVFYIHKLTQVIIVSKNKNFIFSALYIVVSDLKNFNNS